MLFASYWELSENVAVQDQFGAAQKIMSSELFPPQGVNIVHWDYIKKVGGYLVSVAEAQLFVCHALRDEMERVETANHVALYN